MVGALCLALVPVWGWASACEDPRPLRMALIPKSNVQQQRIALVPLLRALELALQRRVEVGLFPSYGAVIEGLLSDAVDVAELGPASYALLMDREASAVAPFAALSGRDATEPGKVGAYHSVLITRKRSGLATLRQLKGRSVALTDPASTSGALLPRSGMRQLTGLPLDAYFSRVSYAGSHDRAILALHSGRVDAAFVSTNRLDDAVRKGVLDGDDITVVWRSPPVPTDPFVLRNRLCPGVAAAIREVFLNPQPGYAAMFQGLDAGPFVAVSDLDYQGVRNLLATDKDASRQ